MSEASQTSNDLAEALNGLNDLAEALNGLTDLNFQLPYPEDSDLQSWIFRGC